MSLVLDQLRNKSKQKSKLKLGEVRLVGLFLFNCGLAQVFIYSNGWTSELGNGPGDFLNEIDDHTVDPHQVLHVDCFRDIADQTIENI